ncbi:MAG: mannose-1-phosphate guanylyltransferase/mannose-6-phosphate isomerase [Candidatus Jettenia sp.]|nr:mannose-1-phosphate guanylyltransferase/mannose-6-phosphate isomerase [Candidatus Jettenia sp. AMX1]MBC6928212.1 mannose-1-phosphate guanylyltransferase/mannose-6-phosphate isomerase [Candidatus Jettenia sp.]WKZ17572.1 MAG: mannose-1-phosphate guanylyltransferase/mannose-6-phosphate isomerase [Candidatus Jettenia sp. CY-1]GIL19361.1 MAG: mannose-1-phosphate guanylyltransferase/mannose-6-phosphate isomerase [Candidatus Jettenia caeni]KAA0248982.1 MAG: mannose-1-phosphate guanylyltransferase/m
MKALILAGGSGTRLWPLSRQNFPKQFLKLNEDKSLLKQTVERLMTSIPPGDIIIMTKSDYKFYVISELSALSVTHSILEPGSRNTAPAIALGIKYCIDKLGCDKDEVIFVSPSDHIIRPVEKFREYLKEAEEIAKDGFIVTFGIQPTKPETGYGYIKCNRQGLHDKQRYCNAEKFTEKPDRETAQCYLNEGNYYWNSGMFAFTIGTIMEEFKKYAPRIHKELDKGFDEILSTFIQMPDISIDYAIMEKSDKVITLPLDLYWNDIGSWDSLFDVLDKDESGNVKIGNVISINTRGTLILGNKRLISTIGLEDCLIIETDDAILVAKKGEAQKVKDIVNKLKENARSEGEEHVTTYRPWGSYTVLEEGLRYKIKRIVVNPNEKLSMQMHHHRSEHWVVIKGAAKVIVGGEETFMHENESIYIPKSMPHRLENPGKIQLEIIEVQNGEYVEEDDIVRMDDVYDRTKTD